MTADITKLCPELQIIYKEWQMQCINAGLNTHAIVTWRDASAQNAAKEAGLSNAGAGQSAHNCCDADGNPASKAFDFGIFEDDGSYVTNGTDPRYTQAGNIGVGLNLVYGGNWVKFKDWDHLELKDWAFGKQLDISK